MLLLSLFRSARVPFLLLTPVCVGLGISSASLSPVSVDWSLAGLIFTAALMAHIAVNALNEYVDFRSGLDLLTIKTPFSGGSGNLPQRPELARAVLILAIAALVLLLFFAWAIVTRVGPAVVPVGLLGLFLVISYSPWINRWPWLCLIAPGTGFGLLMTGATSWVLANHYSLTTLGLSLVPFLLVNNLLLLNQFPDRDADLKVGRKNLPIVYGLKLSTAVLGASFALCYLIITALYLFGLVPALSLLSLFTLPLAMVVVLGVGRYGHCLYQYLPIMAANVAVTLLTPALLAVGLYWG